MACARGKFGKMFTRSSNDPTQKGLKELDAEELKQCGQLMGGRMMDMGKGDNPNMPTGFVPLGQLLAHDISFDPTPVSEQSIESSNLENLRTPAFDLDSLYGEGPDLSPHLYEKQKRGRFVLDEGKEFDLPRNSQGTALVGDSRNDSNLLLAQLHLAFLKFHNAVWEQANSLKDNIRDERGRFEKTQRLVRWHYQWIILREFLPCLVGRETVLDVLRYGRKLYREKGPSPAMPLEFSAAAFRFGHSQTHAVYRINDNSGRLSLFSSKLLCDKRSDLRGGPISRDYVVNWKYFFNTGAEVAPLASRDSKKIGTELPGPLLHNTPGQPGEPPSLAVRDLLRGKQRGLLSGQEVAQAVKNALLDNGILKDADFLDEKDIWEGDFAVFSDRPAPLWYYILKEAEKKKDGKSLGPVGGRIVAEVIIGLLQEDPESFLYEGKGDLDHLTAILTEGTTKESDGVRWRPILSVKDDRANKKGDFSMVDLLTFAKIDTE
ncbi:MAG: hypothetical protein HY267_00750 [Deltaproteobacteria bacterium]|nr:hypothetical protein [Deltaproteobacteria bacterium]